MKISILVLCLVSSSIIPAYAVDLNSELSSTGTPTKQKFQFQEIVFIDYHNGGRLQEELQSKNITISFSEDSTNPDILNLMDTLNKNLLRYQNSLVKINNLQLHYIASLNGDSKSATIDYKIVVEPTILNYVMAKNLDNQTVLDANWIGLSDNFPIIVSTQYGKIDINRPSGFLQAVLPGVYQQINDTSVENLLNASLIDSSSLVKISPDSWSHLFDPAYIIHETSNWGYNGTKAPITTITVGQSSLGNTFKDITNQADFTLDKNYEIQTVQHASSATIQIDGHAKIQGDSGNLVFVTTPRETGKEQTPSSNLSVQVIYAMAGLGGTVAVAILYWSNKKMKTVSKKDYSPSGPVQYEERRHWADRFEK